MHVGMNRDSDTEKITYLGVPHARGDEPEFKLTFILLGMSSPCTWG